ncbi:MAG: NAD(P)/FAD-dependent oxidoreductase [Acidilobus sp.]
MFDYIVVGAGVVGLSTAYHIKGMSPGSRVLVIDKEDSVGAGDTARSAAAFRAAFTNKVNLQLARGSIAFYEKVQSGGFNLAALEIGYLFVVDERSLRAVREGAEVAASEGAEVEEISSEKLEKSMGMRVTLGGSEEAEMLGVSDVVGGYLFKKAGVLDVEKLVDYYYNKLKTMGVEFSLGDEVKEFIIWPRRPLGIEGEPFPWEDLRVKGVRLADGREVEAAKKVISAVGAWSPELLNAIGLDSFSRPKKRQLFVVKALGDLGPLLKAEGFNRLGYMPFTILPKGAYVRPNPLEGTFWVGMADELGRPFRREDNPQPEERFYTYGILPVLATYLPKFQLRYPDAAWAGHYDMSFDGLPVIYEPFESDLVIAAGTSGSGVMKGDSIGRVAAGVALGRGLVELGDGTEIETKLLGLEGRSVQRELLVI